MLKKLLFLAYQPYKWLFFVPFLAVNTLFFAVLSVALSVAIHPRAGSTIGVVWARVNAWFTPMLVSIYGQHNVDKNTSYVIVANHQSYYDILLIYGWLNIEFKWVMKKELRKVPGLGVACEKIGHIFLDRKNHKESIAALNKAKATLVNGTSVVIFPEGTRSAGQMGAFKRGAFKMAFDLQLPVLPVTINGTGNILPADSLNLLPGKATLTIHPPIDISKYNEKDMGTLMNEVKNTINSSL